MNGKQRVLAAFRGEDADYLPFSPNINLWFYYHRGRGTLPPELADCTHPFAALRYLGADILARWDTLWAQRTVYSAGAYSDAWDGDSGLAESRVTAFNIFPPGKTTHRQRFDTPHGTLTQEWAYSPEAGADYEVKNWWTDWAEYPAVRAMMEATAYQLDTARFHDWVARLGDDGVMMCHVTQSPLKTLHWLAGPANASLFIIDHPQEMRELAQIHEAAALRYLEQIVDLPEAQIFFSGDNLDSAFYPPHFYDDFCASFYRRCADLIHSRGKIFVVHACGRSKKLLARVGAAGIDCLEGVTPRPQGDVELGEVRGLTGNPNFVVNGGMDAPRLTFEEDAEAAIHAYTRNLFAAMGDCRRFIFAASCSTPAVAPWENLLYFRDAARQYGRLS
jgi:hypothetical protein